MSEVHSGRDEMPLFEEYLNSSFPCDDLFFNEKGDMNDGSPLLRTYSEDRGVPSSPDSSRSSSSKDESANEADSDVSLAIRLSNSDNDVRKQEKEDGQRPGAVEPVNTVQEPNGHAEAKVPAGVSPSSFVAPPNTTSYQLNLHGIPTKSRVETQIRLGLQLVRVMPEGQSPRETPIGERFQWLKLPSWAMAKEKLKIQNRRDAPATIDPKRIMFLDARVVKSTEPLEDVTICSGCVTRERKRAQRKKDPPKRASGTPMSGESGPKMDAPELIPLPDEDKKILVFNCPELLEVANGEVVIPTRVTCYCRHHKEKDGFRIIITLRDASNNILASTSSELVLITDDHKTTGKVQRVKDQVTSSVKGQPYLGPKLEPSNKQVNILPGFTTSANNSAVVTPQPSAQQYRPISRRSSISSTATTSRKRKVEQCGTNVQQGLTPKMQKVPGTLSMTNMDTPRDLAPTAPPPNVTSCTASPIGQHWHFKRSPSQDSLSHFMNTATSQEPTSTALPSPVQTTSIANSVSSPETRFFDTSMDEVMHDRNISLSPRTRTWDYIMDTASQHETMGRQASIIMPPTQMQQGQQAPAISRMIPAEGPLQGGIEVTILGNGFYPGMTAMFGGTAAVPTHCWSATTLVCVLPPAVNAGPVPATFKEHPYSIGAKLFTYIDETDRALYELALQVIGLKTTGRLETARDVAMRICSSKLPSESVDVNFGSMPINQLRMALGMTDEGPNAEELVRRCLRYLDEIENDRPVRISHRSRSGHTLLHLAIGKGYHNLVQDLLERGAISNMRDKASYTSLHVAALYGNAIIARQLLVDGAANVTLCTSDGRTAYDLATLHDDSELLELLDPWASSTFQHTSPSIRNSRRNSISSLGTDYEYTSGLTSRQSSASLESLASLMTDTQRDARKRSISSRADGTRTQPSSRAQSPSCARTSSLGLHASGRLRSRSASTTLTLSALSTAQIQDLADRSKSLEAEAELADQTDVQRVVENLLQLQQTWTAFLAETSPAWLQKTLANANASLPEVLKTTPNLGHHMQFPGSPISAFQAMLPHLPQIRPLSRSTSSDAGSSSVPKTATSHDSGWLQTLVSSLGAPPSYAEATLASTDVPSPSTRRESRSADSGVRLDDVLDSCEETVVSPGVAAQGWFGKSLSMPFRSQGRVADMTPEQQRAQVKRFQKSADRMMFFFWLPCLLFFIAISIGKAFFDKLFAIFV